MLFTSDSLTVEIFLFITLFVACKWAFRKSWLNQVLLIGGNILILCHIATPKSLFLLSLLALLAYGA
jgi:hypothetical protein